MKKLGAVVGYLYFLVINLTFGFIIPIFVLKSFHHFEDVWYSALSWTTIKTFLYSMFALLGAGLMGFSTYALLITIDKGTLTRSTTRIINLSCLTLALICFFYTQIVGKNIITVAFIILFAVFGNVLSKK
ncbi:hypothetical protein [Pedobacter sp. L105]|uniref:hypothetical protein n=1 Tax=Pedobacter sp. L105 TaxID=1641871 RepID=UPI00131CEC43|nr:hypothetical protein [Pedobacter sp. L105]